MVRVVVAAVPAALAVTFVVLILFLALFMGEHRRQYALSAAAWATDLAKSMIGIQPAEEERPAITDED